MSGRTRSKTIQFSDTPTMHFSSMLEQPPPSPPVNNDEAFSHNASLLSMMGKMAMPSMLDTRGAVGAGRRKASPVVEDRGGESYGEGREQLMPAVEDRGGKSYSEGREQLMPAVEGRGGRSYGEGREQLTHAVEDCGGSSYGEGCE